MILHGIILREDQVQSVLVNGRPCRIPTPAGLRVLARWTPEPKAAARLIEGLSRFYGIEVPR